MAEKHPAILLFGDSKSLDFPLIMCVGREPNDQGFYGDSVGTYDKNLVMPPRVGFWNTAFKVVADVEGTTVKQLKETCRSYRSSILAFADVSPKPILSRIAAKGDIRSSVTRQEKEKHIKSIFSKPLIERVRIFLLSGIAGPQFSEARSLFVSECEARKKAFYDLPFFFPSNYPRIRESLTPELRNVIHGAYTSWVASASKSQFAGPSQPGVSGVLG